MTAIDRSALVAFTAQQMYDLVNDIEHYPSFMQGCKSAKVISQTELELVGELTLAKAGFSQSFTTKNSLEPGSKITMQLVEGTFKHFSACWQFKPLSDQACKISLQMEFSFSRGMVNFALEKLFNSSANNLVDAVVKRAELIYGSGA